MIGVNLWRRRLFREPGPRTLPAERSLLEDAHRVTGNLFDWEGKVGLAGDLAGTPAPSIPCPF